MSTPSIRRFTADEYLVTERMAERRHEFLDGVIYDMAGASAPHNIIMMNLIMGLGPCVTDHGCQIFSSDMRVQVPLRSLYAYPDVMVVCGELEFADSHLDTIANPTLIIEVLSPSTANYDRNEKASRYRHILSLREYLLIAQDRCCIEQYVRETDTSWKSEEFQELAHTLRFSSVNCELPVSKIYRGVKLRDDVSE